MSVYVGISGWTYEGWRGSFYPPKLPHHQELFFASRELPTIEINGTFYSLQKPMSYLKWYEATPENFIFSVKANRYITHIKRLNDVEIPMANFFSSGLFALEEKMGPILWQFPPSMKFDPDKFNRFLDLLPDTTKKASALARKSVLSKERTLIHCDQDRPLRHAIEIRNDSFINPLFIEMLKDHSVTLVFADTAGKWPYMEDVTGDFLYLRLHGDEELYKSGYDKMSLNFWKKRIVNWVDGKEPKHSLTLLDHPLSHTKKDAFIYFDNDQKVRAPVDAKTLIHKLPVAPKLLH